MEKALLVIDECPIEGKSGSAKIYNEWLETLSNKYKRVCVFVFTNIHRDAIEYKKINECEIFYFNKISNKALWKGLRILGQILTRSLVIPKWAYRNNYASEEIIRKILEKVRPNIIVYNKYYTVDLLGNEEWINSHKCIKIMDVHDDFIERERLEREFIKTKKGEIFSYKLSALKQVLTPWNKIKSENDLDSIYKKMDYLCIASESEYEYEKLKYKGRVKKICWQSTLDNRYQENNKPNKDYDIGIIASDAYFNLEGIEWFLKNIYPKLIRKKTSIKILVAGKCVEYFRSKKYPNVDYIPTIKDIEDFYSNIKLAAIPILHGTGVSVKTLEAIAYRIPFVSTTTGARGIPKTSDIKYITDNEEIYVENIIDILENHKKNKIEFENIFDEIMRELKSSSIENFLKEIK